MSILKTAVRNSPDLKVRAVVRMPTPQRLLLAPYDGKSFFIIFTLKICFFST